MQLHHIDEDPTNHSPVNLAVLCFEDHDRTQIHGGFGKKLLPPEVIQYRDDWIERVQKRREQADQIAAEAMGGRSTQPTETEEKLSSDWTAPPHIQLVEYIKHLPGLRRAAYKRAHRGWDTGITSKMRIATAEVIDIFERVLNHLAAWYPPKHFNGQDAASYFNDFIATRYAFHRAILEPGGPGTGGTSVSVLTGGDVLTDVEKEINDMVEGLIAPDVETITWWRKEWSAAAQNDE